MSEVLKMDDEARARLRKKVPAVRRLMSLWTKLNVVSVMGLTMVIVFGGVLSLGEAWLALLLVPLEAAAQACLCWMYTRDPAKHWRMLVAASVLNIAKGVLGPLAMLGLLLYTGTSPSELAITSVLLLVFGGWVFGWWRVARVARASAAPVS